MRSQLRAAIRDAGVDRVVLALAAVVILIGALAGQDQGSATDRGFDGLAVVLLAVGVVVVIAGGRVPAWAAVAALALTFVWYGLGYDGLVNLVAMAAFYRLGTSEDQRVKAAVTAAAVVATFVVMAAVADESIAAAANAAGYLVVAVLFGELLRNRRLVVAQYAERARRAEVDAERRVAEERLAIARDLHDVLAHTVSVMNVQAGVAADSLDRDPSAARTAIGALRAAGREALGEVRATVAVLRSGPSEPATAPAPDVGRIPSLADVLRARGMHVELAIDPAAHDVPPVVGLTAFRVAQEAVTNVVRHADATWVRIGLTCDDGMLAIEVRDDGPRTGVEEPAAGMGLRGMAERVESIGGVLHHGRGTTGWAVVARLPVPLDAA